MGSTFPSTSTCSKDIPRSGGGAAFPSISRINDDNCSDCGGLVRRTRAPLCPKDRRAMLRAIVGRVDVGGGEGGAITYFGSSVTLLGRLLPTSGGYPRGCSGIGDVLDRFNLRCVGVSTYIGGYVLCCGNCGSTFRYPRYCRPECRPRTHSERAGPVPEGILHCFPLNPHLRHLCVSSRATGRVE